MPKDSTAAMVLVQHLTLLPVQQTHGMMLQLMHTESPPISGLTLSASTAAFVCVNCSPHLEAARAAAASSYRAVSQN